MATPMMKCGHAANSTCDGKPACVICAGIHPGAYEIDDTPTNLSKRFAICSSCKSTVPSSSELAFFQHRPDKELDTYYCGCRGWD